MVSEIHRKSSISCICMCKYKYKILYAIYDITHNFILKPRNLFHFFFLLKHFQLLLGKENCQVFLQVPLLMAIFVHYHSTDDNNIYYLYINDWKLLGDGRAVKQS